MQFKKLSLRTRIFVSMIILVVIASILIAAVTIYQFNEQAEDYHVKRLERKEGAIKEAIFYELKHSSSPLESEYLSGILDKKLNEIADIHNLDINIYDLKGKLLRSSNAQFSNDRIINQLPKSIINTIENDATHRVVKPIISPDGKKFKSSYSYIINIKFKPIGIIGIPYLQDNTFQDEELKEFLQRLFLVYIIILLIAIGMAYLLSKYITKSLEKVSKRMQQIDFVQNNEKIILEDNQSEEITNLVNSYNNMIDQLEESAVKLAQVERKQAWREMAKQVAHEIKNPLTPMRLTVQSFEQSFDPTDPDIKQKLQDYSKSIIQQIDTMSSIASAFSNFAEMPKPKKEELSINEEVKLALNIFHENYIHFHSEKKNIKAYADKVQLTRVVTNLVKNAIQALKNVENPKIDVGIYENTKHVYIEVKDNGKGISKEDETKVFEPKFTTKTSGMGLGLPMVKNIIEAYGGDISFTSIPDKETIFTVTLPKSK
ncbi:MAG: ATP-binding protein [Bacteroidota bacterium]